MFKVQYSSVVCIHNVKFLALCKLTKFVCVCVCVCVCVTVPKLAQYVHVECCAFNCAQYTKASRLVSNIFSVVLVAAYISVLLPVASLLLQVEQCVYLWTHNLQAVSSHSLLLSIVYRPPA